MPAPALAVLAATRKAVPAGPSVYFSDTFDGTGTMDTTTTEVGGKTWSKSGGTFTKTGTGDLRDTSTATHAQLGVNSLVSDMSLVGDMTFGRGSATGHWSGLYLLGSTAAAIDSLSVRPDGTSALPTLKLFQGTATVLENWDISAILLTATGARLIEGDRAILRIDYNAATYTISVYLDNQLVGSHVLAGTTGPATGNKATYGSNTWHGLYSNERINPGDHIWHSVVCQARV